MLLENVTLPKTFIRHFTNKTIKYVNSIILYLIEKLLIKKKTCYVLCIFAEMSMYRATIAPLSLASRRLPSYLPLSLDADLMSLAILENLARIAAEPDNASNVSYDATKISRRFARFPPTARVI